MVTQRHTGRFRRANKVSALIIAGLLAWDVALARSPQGAVELSPESATTRVSDHVSVIMGFPNVGIVTGSRATLVIDTGLGPRNGAAIARQAAKLAGNSILYLTTTHFHPEHAAGEAGFPPNTILIRPVVQQKELERNGMAMVEMFRNISPLNKELLQGVKFRAPDIVFDKELTLGLGGVTARLLWMGTAHTLGDELIYVEPDQTLLPGDIVQNKMLPSLYGPDARLNSWIKILSELRPLAPRHIVPDHGDLGDGSLLEQEYAFLSDLQTRALELKRQGKSADEAGQALLVEFKTKYAAWPNLNGIPVLVKHIYAEQ